MDQQLEDYIKQSRQKGKTDESIRRELLGSSWSNDQINEYLKTNAQLTKHSPGRIPERLIVSYFSYLGLYLLFSFYALKFIPLQISSTLAPLIFTVIYLPILYLLWEDLKLAILIAIGSMLSFYVLAIVFVFTFPIWMVFGPICLAYAFLTGLFKKQSQIPQLENNISISQIPESHKKRIFKLPKPFIGVALLFVFLYGTYHVAFYGFKLDRCVYTDEELAIPEELKNATILLEKNMYIAKGHDPDDCSPLLKDIKNQIVHTETIDNITVGARYFTERGLAVESFMKGKTFTLNKFVAVTKHGLSTIDSGPGPLYYLILTDERGVVYQIHTSDLGYDEREAYFSYSNNGARQGLLSWKWFVDYNERQIANPFPK